MAYRDVPPRYLTPRPRNASPQTSPAPPPREQFQTNKQWASVPPRFAESRPESPRPAPLDTSNPLTHWREKGVHDSLASRLGFGAVPSRFYADAREKGDLGENSPRRAIEEARSARKQKPWSSFAPKAGRHTFDDMLPEYYTAHAELAPPAPGASKVSKKAFSSVGEYIRTGSPIRHHAATTEQKPRVKRHQSPVPFRSPGVRESNFDALKKLTLGRKECSMEEWRVAEERNARRAKVVPKDFTPRVAKLAAAYQIDHVPDYDEGSEAATTPDPSRRGNSFRQSSPSPVPRSGSRH